MPAPTQVQGGQTYTGLEISPQRSVGEDPTYPARWARVGFAGESMKEERASLGEREEIVPSGAVQFHETGAGRWRGTFTTLLYYNAQWFHWLMCQAAGGLELLDLDKMPEGTATPGTLCNTHTYLQQSYLSNLAGSEAAVTHGLAIRVWKMGPSNPAGSAGMKILNARVMEVQIEHRQNDWPKATWTVEGDAPTELSGSGVTLIARAAGEYPVKPGDLSADHSHAVLPSRGEIGTLLAEGAIRSWSARLNTGLGFPPNAANSFDVGYRPGHVQRAAMEGTVEETLRKGSLTDLEPGALDWGHLIGGAGALELRYISAPTGASHTEDQPVADDVNNVPYALQFHFFGDIDVEQPGNLDSGALVQRANFHGYQGVLNGTDHAFAATLSGAWSAGFLVHEDDEPAINTKYNTTAEGGNDAHSSLTP